MARYSLFVLKVPLKPQASKQTNYLHLPYSLVVTQAEGAANWTALRCCVSRPPRNSAHTLHRSENSPDPCDLEPWPFCPKKVGVMQLHVRRGIFSPNSEFLRLCLLQFVYKRDGQTDRRTDRGHHWVTRPPCPRCTCKFFFFIVYYRVLLLFLFKACQWHCPLPVIFQIKKNLRKSCWSSLYEILSNGWT